MRTQISFALSNRLHDEISSTQQLVSTGYFLEWQVRGEQTSLEDCMHLLAMKEQTITQLRQRLEDSAAKLEAGSPAEPVAALMSGVTSEEAGGEEHAELSRYVMVHSCHLFLVSTPMQSVRDLHRVHALLIHEVECCFPASALAQPDPDQLQHLPHGDVCLVTPCAAHWHALLA